MVMYLGKKLGNDVNGATYQGIGGSASGRGGDNGATQVVNQRKPRSRRKGRLFNGREEVCIGTWKVRTWYAAGKLEVLLNHLIWSIMGLVTWPGEGEITKDGYRIICSGSRMGSPTGSSQGSENGALIGYRTMGPRMMKHDSALRVTRPQ